jgi:hypothetical protein
MKKLFCWLLMLGCAASFAQTPPVTPPLARTTEGNFAGLLYASNFGQWQVPQGNLGTYSWNSPSYCYANTVGVTFLAFKVGTPITIVDTGNPSATEIVTPTAVTITQPAPGNMGSCAINIAPVNPHTTYHYASATAGLQEAINWAGTTVYTVVLSPDWALLGGTTGMITAAAGNASVSIFDERTASAVVYTWNGSAYVATGGYLPTGCVASAVGNITCTGTGTFGNAVVTTAPLTAVGTAYACGNSLTAGGEDYTFVSFPNQLALLLGNTVTNGGVGGQTSSQEAVRCYNAYAGQSEQTFATGFTIPTSGTVTCPFQTGFEPGAISSQGVLITTVVSGVTYTLSAAASNVCTPQTYPASPVVVPSGNAWLSVLPPNVANGFNVLWLCRNNLVSTTQCLADYAAVIAALPSPKRFLVLAEINSSYEIPTTTGYNEVIAMNAALQAAYPSNYFDIRHALVEQYNPAIPADVIDFNNDTPPTSLRAGDGQGALTTTMSDTTSCTFTVTVSPAGIGNGVKMLIDSENIAVTATSGDNVTGCIRGYNGSTAATHAIGAHYLGTDPLHLGSNQVVAPGLQSNGLTYVAQQVYAWMLANDPIAKNLAPTAQVVQQTSGSTQLYQIAPNVCNLVENTQLPTGNIIRVDMSVCTTITAEIYFPFTLEPINIRPGQRLTFNYFQGGSPQNVTLSTKSFVGDSLGAYDSLWLNLQPYEGGSVTWVANAGTAIAPLFIESAMPTNYSYNWTPQSIALGTSGACTGTINLNASYMFQHCGLTGNTTFVVPTAGIGSVPFIDLDVRNNSGFTWSVSTSSTIPISFSSVAGSIHLVNDSQGYGWFVSGYTGDEQYYIGNAVSGSVTAPLVKNLSFTMAGNVTMTLPTPANQDMNITFVQCPATNCTFTFANPPQNTANCAPTNTGASAITTIHLFSVISSFWACTSSVPGTTWPTSGDAVISNGTNTPAGVAEVDGDCMVGSAGAWTAGGCSSGSTGISGAASGQALIAGSATTATSSKALAGSGAGLTTGPTTAVSGDVAGMTGTGGQIQDLGTPAALVTSGGGVTALCKYYGLGTNTGGTAETQISGTTCTIPSGTLAATSTAKIDAWFDACDGYQTPFSTCGWLVSITAISGGSIAGTGTVTLSGFNNGCTSSTGTVTLASGVFSSAVVNTLGNSCTAPPTSATCTSGSGATCSGTVTITTTASGVNTGTCNPRVYFSASSTGIAGSGPSKNIGAGYNVVAHTPSHFLGAVRNENSVSAQQLTGYLAATNTGEGGLTTFEAFNTGTTQYYINFSMQNSVATDYCGLIGYDITLIP